jgi:hypothetical protein
MILRWLLLVQVALQSMILKQQVAHELQIPSSSLTIHQRLTQHPIEVRNKDLLVFILYQPIWDKNITSFMKYSQLQEHYEFAKLGGIHMIPNHV